MQDIDNVRSNDINNVNVKVEAASEPNKVTEQKPIKEEYRKICFQDILNREIGKLRYEDKHKK